MMDVQINFLAAYKKSPQLSQMIEDLDKLAFADEDQNDPIMQGIEWSSSTWMGIALLGDQLVAQLGLLKREILVGDKPVTVCGVGGVATHPDWQKKGFATQLLRATQIFMSAELKVHFGLLICADETAPVYAGCGWQPVAQALLYHQDGERHSLPTMVMILPLSDEPWPEGEIDLCGLPW
jgi:GNAT superfamily N-acetyltransferase